MQLPVVRLMRPLPVLERPATLGAVAERMRDSRAPLAAIVGADQAVVATLDQRAIAAAVAEARPLTDDAEEAAYAVDRLLIGSATGAEALRAFSDRGVESLVVVDPNRRPLGVLVPADLVPGRAQSFRPPLVGGMATPFGVYLTSGSHGAGASGMALVTAGMLLFTLFLVGFLVSDLAASLMLERGADGWPVWIVEGVGPLAVFLLGMRLLPIAGTHAAEHMVVHAIERGEPLTPDVVRRMPRVHPRCGTNLAVGLSLFLAVGTWDAIDSPTLRLLAAALLAAVLWRPLGSFVQKAITTRPPTDTQIRNAIAAGEALLAKYAADPTGTPSFPRRLWNSGLFHVLLGSNLCYGTVYLVARAVGVDLGL